MSKSAVNFLVNVTLLVALLATLLAFVAGIMIYISIDEIIPTAHSYGKGHVVIFGVVLGVLIMALSLFML